MTPPPLTSRLTPPPSHPSAFSVSASLRQPVSDLRHGGGVHGVPRPHQGAALRGVPVRRLRSSVLPQHHHQGLQRYMAFIMRGGGVSLPSVVCSHLSIQVACGIVSHVERIVCGAAFFKFYFYFLRKCIAFNGLKKKKTHLISEFFRSGSRNYEKRCLVFVFLSSECTALFFLH